MNQPEHPDWNSITYLQKHSPYENNESDNINKSILRRKNGAYYTHETNAAPTFVPELEA